MIKKRGPLDKAAEIRVYLHGDGGYVSDVSGRVSRDQWRRICEVLHETAPPSDRPHASTAAIEYALSQGSEGLTFLRLWSEGEFETIRREWPDAPDAVFEGADPLHPGAK